MTPPILGPVVLLFVLVVLLVDRNQLGCYHADMPKVKWEEIVIGHTWLAFDNGYILTVTKQGGCYQWDIALVQTVGDGTSNTLRGAKTAATRFARR